MFNWFDFSIVEVFNPRPPIAQVFEVTLEEVFEPVMPIEFSALKELFLLHGWPSCPTSGATASRSVDADRRYRRPWCNRTSKEGIRRFQYLIGEGTLRGCPFFVGLACAATKPCSADWRDCRDPCPWHADGQSRDHSSR